MSVQTEARKRFEIAVYGKGGIGKSTVSANLSASLAKENRKVLQIGCDPKHDSVRLLMGGRNIPTVLDYLRDTPAEATELSAVLQEGALGVGCVEAGGPKPGVGCAGRGVITAFEFLDKKQAKDPYDVVVYDVLGDVVCGGFAVPVRREYADAVFLVTSGEYMALYAANNILRGIRNFDGENHARVAGIIYNERKLEDEDGRVSRFAEAVGLPICAKVPRSQAFAAAEEANCTVAQLEGYEEERAVFSRLAATTGPDMPLHCARPLSDDELEEVVLGTGRTKDAPSKDVCSRQVACEDEVELPKAQTATEAAASRMPLYGCAFNGAATTAIHLTDALVVAHAPKACAFYTWQNISSTGRKNLFNRGILMPSSILPNFACTNMGQTEAVFGGMDTLRSFVKGAMEDKPGAIVVVSSCVSGIIGDDVLDVESLSTDDTPVIAIPADGDIAGDYMEGIRLAMHTLARRLIRKDVPKKERCINIVGEVGVSYQTASNLETIRALLKPLGISINCRFLGDATCEELGNFMAAPLNVMAHDGADVRELRSFLEEEYGAVFMEEPLPVGFEATAAWLEKLCEFFGCAHELDALVTREGERYRSWIKRLEPVLRGKRVFMTTINVNIDWLLEPMTEAGLEVVCIGVANYLRQEVKVTNHPERYPVINDTYDWTQMASLIKESSPDLVLSNYTSSADEGDYVVDAIPMSPRVGFQSGLHLLERWATLLTTRREGAWKDDKELFESYFG